MTLALFRDAIRLLLRSRLVFVACGTGVLLGAFVRATQQSYTSELAGLDARGAAVASLVSGLFIVALCIALVCGVLLANEDHASGLIAQIAIRPVTRLRYVVGRVGGLVTVIVIASALVVGIASALALFGVGDGDRGLPELRVVARAERLVVDGVEVAPHDLVPLEIERVARFEFAARSASNLRLRIEPLVKNASKVEEQFDGYVTLEVRCAAGADELVTTKLEHYKVQTVELGVPNVRGRAFTVEVVNRTRGAALFVSRDHLVGSGEPASGIVQFGYAAVLLFLAASVLGVLAFALATGLSTGPAALAASFFLLVALAKDAVLDLAMSAYPWLVPAIRLVPDLGALDLSDRLGRGEAVDLMTVGTLAGSAVLQIAVLLVAACALLSWRDRNRDGS